MDPRGNSQCQFVTRGSIIELALQVEPAVLSPTRDGGLPGLAWGLIVALTHSHRLSERLFTPGAISHSGIDIGSNSFHVVGLDQGGAVACAADGHTPRSKLPPCLISMQACVAAHRLRRQEAL